MWVKHSWSGEVLSCEALLEKNIVRFWGEWRFLGFVLAKSVRLVWVFRGCLGGRGVWGRKIGKAED